MYLNETLFLFVLHYYDEAQQHHPTLISYLCIIPDTFSNLSCHPHAARSESRSPESTRRTAVILGIFRTISVRLLSKTLTCLMRCCGGVS